MEAYVENLKALRKAENVYCYNLPDLTRDFLEPKEIPSLSNLLRAIKAKSGSSALHIIIDDFETEDLNKKECENLNFMFKSAQWAECSVVLLVQPMIKTRTLVSPDGFSMSYETDSKAYQEIDSMFTFSLKFHIRSTVSNFQFTQTATEIIAKDVKNTITHHTPDISVRKRKGIKKKTNAKRGKLDNQIKESETKQEEKPLQQAPTQKLNDKEEATEAELLPPRLDELTQVLPPPLEKLMDKEPPSEDSTRTETRYSFKQSQEVGHNITGSIPSLIYVEDDLNDEENITSVSVALKELCSITNCKSLWICKFKEGFVALKNILKMLIPDFIIYHELNQYKLQDQSGKSQSFANWGLTHYNIITDNMGCRGLEAEKVFIFVEEESRNSQQDIVETAARSTSELFIINFHYNKKKVNLSCTNSILDTAVANKQIKSFIIKTENSDDNDFDQIHIESKDEFTNHAFVYKTKAYKESLLAVHNGLREMEKLGALHHSSP